MTFKFLKIMGIGFILSCSMTVNASLLFTDNGDYTTDTVSGLDWLDWSLTVNTTTSDALTAYSSAGWRVPTHAEALNMIELFFTLDFIGGTTTITDLVGSADSDHERFNNLFGVTTYVAPVLLHPSLALIGDAAIGVWTYDSGGLITQVEYYANDIGLFQFHQNLRNAEDREYTTAGIALVRVNGSKNNVVSEPAIITILALGLVGIGFARRRQS